MRRSATCRPYRLSHLPVALVTATVYWRSEAMQLFMRLDRELLEARAQWNQDWFRRLMRIRPRAVRRLRRRWERLESATLYPLGTLAQAISRQFSLLPLRHSIIVTALCLPLSPRGVRSSFPSMHSRRHQSPKKRSANRRLPYPSTAC